MRCHDLLRTPEWDRCLRHNVRRCVRQTEDEDADCAMWTDDAAPIPAAQKEYHQRGLHEARSDSLF